MKLEIATYTDHWKNSIMRRAVTLFSSTSIPKHQKICIRIWYPKPSIKSGHIALSSLSLGYLSLQSALKEYNRYSAILSTIQNDFKKIGIADAIYLFHCESAREIVSSLNNLCSFDPSNINFPLNKTTKASIFLKKVEVSFNHKLIQGRLSSENPLGLLLPFFLLQKLDFKGANLLFEQSLPTLNAPLIEEILLNNNPMKSSDKIRYSKKELYPGHVIHHQGHYLIITHIKHVEKNNYVSIARELCPNTLEPKKDGLLIEFPFTPDPFSPDPTKLHLPEYRF